MARKIAMAAMENLRVLKAHLILAGSPVSFNAKAS
jgi:hypothetical protein